MTPTRAIKLQRRRWVGVGLVVISVFLLGFSIYRHSVPSLEEINFQTLIDQANGFYASSIHDAEGYTNGEPFLRATHKPTVARILGQAEDWKSKADAYQHTQGFYFSKRMQQSQFLLAAGVVSVVLAVLIFLRDWAW